MKFDTSKIDLLEDVFGNIDLDHDLPKAVRNYIDHTFLSTNQAIAKAIGVKYLMEGQLKVRDEWLFR